VDGPAPAEVEIRIARQAAGFAARQDGRVLLEAPDARATMEALHDHLLRAALAERPREAVLHAASLVRDGRRLLLVGAKGAGKTTLALRLAMAGFAIEGDENVFLRPATVVARPRGCRVKASALKLLADIAPLIEASPHHDGPGGRLFNLDPGRLGGPWRIAEGPVDHVFAIRPNHGGQSAVAPLSQAALFAHLMAETAWREADRAASVAGLAAIAHRAAAFELTLGDHGGAVACIESAAIA
jgi:energy-coupling factor transporter ATP-binding protein EcfA2